MLDGAPLVSSGGVLVRGRHLHIPSLARRPGGLQTPGPTESERAYRCVANNSAGAIVSREAKVIRACEYMGFFGLVTGFG